MKKPCKLALILLFILAIGWSSAPGWACGGNHQAALNESQPDTEGVQTSDKTPTFHSPSVQLEAAIKSPDGILEPGTYYVHPLLTEQGYTELTLSKDDRIVTRFALHPAQTEPTPITQASGFPVIHTEATIAEDKKEKRFYLSAQKLPAAAKYHPKRIRPKQKTPDFGHWVLRRVQKNWWYPTIEEANADLMALAEEFPLVCIPATNKLYAMIYRSAPKGTKPVNRYVLEIKAHEQGGFRIDLAENHYVAKPKAPKKAAPVRETAGETQGKFTALEKLKRSRKRTDAPAS